MDIMQKKVGRPRILERQNIIDIAFNEYWEKGIFNVSISRIAKLANVSRPGIYKEFGDEDNLKEEVLNRYVRLSADPCHKNYFDYKNYPNHLFNHFDAIINDGNKNLTEDPAYLNIERPKKAIGCLMERTRLNSNLLGPKSKELMKKYTQYRKKCFQEYIRNAQADKKIKKHLNPEFLSEYILALFNILQINRLNRLNKSKIEQILHLALSPILTK